MFSPRTRSLIKTLFRPIFTGVSPDLVQALKKELPEFPVSALRAMGRPFVDKSGAYLSLLASEGLTYSLHRPARMGKTTNVSMLAHYHLDPRLFDDLHLGKLLKLQVPEWKFLQEKKKRDRLSSAEDDFLTFYTPLQFRKQRPVLYFNLKTLSNEEKSLEFLKTGFNARCRMYAEQIFGLNFEEDKLSTSFRTLLTDIKEKTGLLPAVFIEEYDHPIWFKGDPDLDHHYEGNRSILRSIFRGLKDAKVHFGLVTGVTPATKLVLTSASSFVKDVSCDLKYEYLCGFTKEEVKTHFGERIKTAAGKENMTEKEVMDKLTLFYGGQSFSPAVHPVLNPDSVQSFFDSGEFRLHSTVSGEAEYVQWAIKRFPALVFNSRHEFTWPEDPNLERNSFKTALRTLWSLGYFSPKRADSTMEPYLRVPNIEQGTQLKLWLQKASYPGTLLTDLEAAFDNSDIPMIVTCLNQALWELSLHSEKELAYKVAIDALLYRINVPREGENQVGPGRADLVIYAKTLNLIIELKIHHEDDEIGLNAERGMKALQVQRYHTRFLMNKTKKDVYVLAMSIDPINRLVNEFTYAKVVSQGKEVDEEKKFVDMRPVIAEMKEKTRDQKGEIRKDEEGGNRRNLKS